MQIIGYRHIKHSFYYYSKGLSIIDNIIKHNEYKSLERNTKNEFKENIVVYNDISTSSRTKRSLLEYFEKLAKRLDGDSLE
jgi:hypothetical protein